MADLKQLPIPLPWTGRTESLCSVHFEEICFEVDVFHHFMWQDPLNYQRRRVLTWCSVNGIYYSPPGTTLKAECWTFSVVRSDRSKVNILNLQDLKLISLILYHLRDCSNHVVFEVRSFVHRYMFDMFKKRLHFK